MSKKKWLIVIPLILMLAYLAGPSPARPSYSISMPVVPASAFLLENYILQKENQHHLKPDNQARIIWYNDSLKNKTDYAIVYLHGFSASQFEGAPTHENIAKMFGCNLYLSRLAEHGIDTVDALINLTADEYWESSKEALAIGKQIGKKVILMGTSTGGTNALQLAATYPGDVEALILLSPNIAINDPNAWVLNNHWGKQIANMVKGSPYNTAMDTSAVYKQYWNYQYRLEAAVALEEYLETTMTPGTFKKVKQPVLLLYYYKDEQHQDPVVKVSAMKEMFDELGTKANGKRESALPNTGNHVIASPFKSHDAIGVQNEIEKFMEEMLGLKRVE
ncbi:MAG TPA: alpha/beta hydrolase [Chitinophagaceae bacterium]|nr:alpha/beta hydrolase [Chitinophagaceae bacterium]